jgi:general secretion pathway protein K
MKRPRVTTHTRSEAPRGRREGIALMVALLFVLLLTVIAVEFAYESQVDAAFSSTHLERQHARVAARSAVAQGMALLAQDVANPANEGGAQYDAYIDLWGLGVPYVQLNDAILQATVDDESGKIPLNRLVTAEGEVDELLLEATRYIMVWREAPEDTAEAIVEWMGGTGDDAGGAFGATEYEQLEVPYALKAAPFDAVEELLLVRGITPEVYFGDPEADPPLLPLSELFTVHGAPDSRINLNTAPREVLEAIREAAGENYPDVEALLNIRESESALDSLDYAYDTGILRQADPDQPSLLDDRFAVESRRYRIRGHGLAGEVMLRVEAYVDRSGGPGRGGSQGMFRILDWRVIQ